MEIREKINRYLTENSISYKEIAEGYGVAAPTISNYFAGKREIPLDFLVWFVANYPIDVIKLFDRNYQNIIGEGKVEYETRQQAKAKALEKISLILDDLVG